mmetsp:Transcript_49594/g.141778  ORF Transcript_49594/g.141778 Transcript_49594/m.141778 type:complete len:234 (+) Transcript_49594:1048-1749(+)
MGGADHLGHRPHQNVVVVRAVLGQLVLLELDDARLDLEWLKLGVLTGLQPGRLLVGDLLFNQDVICGLVAEVSEVELRAWKREQWRDEPQEKDLALVTHGRVRVAEPLVLGPVGEGHLHKEPRVKLGMRPVVLHDEEALHARATHGVLGLRVLGQLDDLHLGHAVALRQRTGRVERPRQPLGTHGAEGPEIEGEIEAKVGARSRECCRLHPLLLRHAPPHGEGWPRHTRIFFL